MNPNMTLCELFALPMIERETILREMRDKHTRRVSKVSAEIFSLEQMLAERQRKRLAAWAPGDEPKGDE